MALVSAALALCARRIFAAASPLAMRARMERGVVLLSFMVPTRCLGLMLSLGLETVASTLQGKADAERARHVYVRDSACRQLPAPAHWA